MLTWQHDALCRGTDVHYDPDGREPEDARAHRVAEALALCGMCPTRDACLDFALDSERGTTGGRHGIWGGLTPEERDREARRRARRAGSKPRAGRTLKPCGTDAAYRRHLRERETPCEPCRAAARRREARKRAKRGA